MPESGIQKILRNRAADPASGKGIPRCELYMYVDSPRDRLEVAIEAGATEVEREMPRDWGDSVAYCTDPDGHVIAFARKL